MVMDESRRYTAFGGGTLIASGELATVLPLLKRWADAAAGEEPIVFDDATGRQVDFDLRGTVAAVLARVVPPRGPGRPKLGVVAREVTLLPRHWDWLNAQPGGASVALRKLVEQARRAGGDAERARAARDAAYHFMSVMAGNLSGFEEASRALFADDRRRMAGLIAGWPDDIRDHVVRLAFGDLAEPP